MGLAEIPAAEAPDSAVERRVVESTPSMVLSPTRDRNRRKMLLELPCLLSSSSFATFLINIFN